MKRTVSTVVYWVKWWLFGGVSSREASSRADVCRECVECRWRTYDRRAIIGWCGGPLARGRDVCGCPVVRVPKQEVAPVLVQPTVGLRRIKAKGLAVPFRKTLLSGQRCPQGKW